MDRVQSKKLADEIVSLIDERKAKDIEVIQNPKLEAVTDYFIVCTGTSSTHLRGIADHVLEKLKEKDINCIHLEGYDTASWILLDYMYICCFFSIFLPHWTISFTMAGIILALLLSIVCSTWAST